MKDIVIKGSSVRRELIVLACCAVAAVILDLVAIARYHKPFTELFQTVGYIVFIAVVTYLLVGLIRLVVCLAVRAVKRISTTNK